MTDPSDPLALYIHWPYCARICPYCDFNVHLDRRAGEADQLVQAIATDMAHWRAWTGPRTLGSIHFGGGTPSLLTQAQLTDLIEAARGLWTVPEIEVAIEANPNDVTEARLDGWKAAGITRLSLGVQSFDDAVLRRLGRDHDGASARRAVEQAMRYIPSVSVDLIFGVAGEAPTRLSTDLDQLLADDVPHISTYQLTIEPNTAFARAEARGESRAVDDGQSADDFEAIRARLTKAGYRHYEVSNFAKPGSESQHNLAYWRGQDYVGVGPGAHGRLWTKDGRTATETQLRPADYIQHVMRTGSGLSETEVLSADAAAEEYVLMGLRIEEGISRTRLSALTDQPITLDPDLIAEGWLAQDGDRLFATAKGRLVLDALTRALLV
jgi:oxygen-independent coproporphyrinogen-3 oxidase